HKAAAALLFFLPGMVLLHDGQLEGRKFHAPIQMNKRAPEECDLQIQRFYHELLDLLPRTHLRRGTPELIRIPGAESLIAIRWSEQERADWGLVNLTREFCQVPL